MPPFPAAVFCLSAFFLFYALFGYPLLLALLGRLFPKPVRKEDCRPSVSVLLPVRDGERWIAQKLDSLLKLDYPRELLQILVVSDGSRDRSEEIVSQYAPHGVELIRIPASGKAVALNTALERARGEILFFTDVRQPLHPRCLAYLVSCFADPAVGVATGELVILDGATREEANTGLYWKYEKWIRRQLNRVGSLLVVTGAVYAMRRVLARPLPVGALIDDAILPLGPLLAGHRIVFEQRARAFDYPTALNVEFRRKVRTLAGLFQVVRIYPALLNPFRKAGFHFLSYKMSRLLLPYALLALLLASFGLPSPWRTWLVGAQAGFYALALLDLAVPESWALKRPASVARAFVVLMAAALCAAAVCFVPAERIWNPTQTGRRPAQ